MNNLDWSNAEDEKDKRIRELEDTLRKQKELMEILQVHVDDLHDSQLILILISLLVSREKCSCPKMTISPNLYPRSQMKFPTFKSLNSMEGRKSVQTLGKQLPSNIFDLFN